MESLTNDADNVQENWKKAIGKTTTLHVLAVVA